VAPKKLFFGLAVVWMTAVCLPSCARRPPPTDLIAEASPSLESIRRYDVLELTLRHNGAYDNKFFDASLTAVFTSPRGVQRRISGFFYGGDQWKVRFRPDEPGRWTYASSFHAPEGFAHQGRGAFECLPNDAEGPLQRHPHNPHRWTFANGDPYFPLGLQGCVFAAGEKSSGDAIDGGTREQGGRSVSRDEYFAIYGRAGFNLFRFSQRNCSLNLYDSLDRYRAAEGKAVDDLLALARKHGFRVMFGFFGYHGDFAEGSRLRRGFDLGLRKTFGRMGEAINSPQDKSTIAKEKRFLDYCIARWGVYADFWELLNERKASDEWTTLMAEYVRSVDPDRKPISTSWEKPLLPAIDINAPHWYESESELQSDLRLQERAERWKQAGKPVLVGEQGNSGMNWDPGSALRMRIRAWTALFQEIGLIFWNTSWSKAGMHGGRLTPGGASNIYLGPEERGYTRVLQDFASRLDAGVQMVAVPISASMGIRAHGLRSGRVAAAYLHHFEEHVTPVRGAKIRLEWVGIDSRTGLVAEWIDPASGAVLQKAKVPAGVSALTVPDFTVDLALLVAPARAAPPASPVRTRSGP